MTSALRRTPSWGERPLKGYGLGPRGPEGEPMLRPDTPPATHPGRPFVDDLDRTDMLMGVKPRPKPARPDPTLPLPKRSFVVEHGVGYGFRLPRLTFRIAEATYRSHREEERLRTFGEIVTAVERAFAVERNDLMSHRRKKWIVGARCALCALLRDFTDWSLPEIGRRVGGRDHTTIIHAIRRCAILATRAGAFSDSLSEARRTLQARGGAP